MTIFTYTDARANLKDVMDQAINDHREVIITRRKGEAVVVVSLEDWSSINETLHLLSTPANAERLRRSITELDAGKGAERELIEP